MYGLPSTQGLSARKALWYLRSEVTCQFGGDPMASTMKDLRIDRLSVDERLALLHEIWDSIAAEQGAPI